jgi:hypothetical protein
MKDKDKADKNLDKNPKTPQNPAKNDQNNNKNQKKPTSQNNISKSPTTKTQ